MASLGQTLREAREARQISIEEIASATKIVPRYLEAIENDRLDIMPGGFFIRGIIRTYAKAIGLDGEEVLARYRAAGLVGEPERKRALFKVGPTPSAPLPPPPPPIAAPPFEPAAPPAAEAATAHDLPFEPAPKPRLSPAARKRIIAWAWRSAAVVLIVAVLAFLWSSRRPRPPEPKPAALATQAVVTGSALPAAQTQPTAPPAEAPPPAEEAWKGVTIEISFQAETWIQVFADGVLKVDGLFPAGSSARAHADEALVVNTGNAGGFKFRLNGQSARPLGRGAQVLTDIRITPANFKELLEVRPPGSPTG